MPTPIDWHGDDDARVCFERVVQQLVDLGCAVETVDAAPMYDAGALMYGSALVAERFAAFGPFALAHPDAMDPAVLDIVRRARDHRASEFVSAGDALWKQRELAAARGGGRPSTRSSSPPWRVRRRSPKHCVTPSAPASNWGG